MKKLLIVCGFAILSLSANAQMGKTSFGLLGATPMGDFSNVSSFGAGISMEYDIALGDNMGYHLTIDGVYLFPSDGIKMAIMVPYHLGFKYYLSSNEEGVFLNPYLGMTTTIVKPEDVVITIPAGYSGGTPTTITERSEASFDTKFSFGAAAGYLITTNIEATLRYNMIKVEGGMNNYIAAKIAFKLG